MMRRRLIALAAPLVLGAVLTACSAGASTHTSASTPGRESGASPDSNIAAIAPESTQQACQHLFPATAPSPPVPQAQFQKLLRFSHCVRTHGLSSWPDPNPQGEFPLPPTLMQKSPAQENAFKACQRYEPSGGVNVVAAP
jgi:hypothetical protein